MNSYNLKFKEPNLEIEWSYREIINKKWDILIGVGFFIAMTLVTDFPAISPLDWTNDAWYSPAAFTRWGFVGIMIIVWCQIYISPVPNHKV